MEKEITHEKLFESVPPLAKDAFLFALERKTERTIWVWLAQAVSLSLLISFHSFSLPSVAILWLLYSGALFVWADRPTSSIYIKLSKSISKEEGSKVYERAAGVKETLVTGCFIALSTAAFLFLVSLFGKLLS